MKKKRKSSMKKGSSDVLEIKQIDGGVIEKGHKAMMDNSLDLDGLSKIGGKGKKGKGYEFGY